MNEDIRKKIAAIYELVKRGSDGEKQAAKVALDRLMKKYNLDASDIESIELRVYCFKYSSNMDMYLLHTLVDYFLEVGAMKGASRSTRKVKEIHMKLNYGDYVTIDCAYHYFRRHMKKQWDLHCADQLKRMRSAKRIKQRRDNLQQVFFGQYVIKSKLYKDGDLLSVDFNTMTQQQVNDFKAMQVIEGGQYNKQMITGNLLEEQWSL